MANVVVSPVCQGGVVLFFLVVLDVVVVRFVASLDRIYQVCTVHTSSVVELVVRVSDSIKVVGTGNRSVFCRYLGTPVNDYDVGVRRGYVDV